MNRKIFIGASFLILLISTLDFNIIPFYKKLGLDFSNHYGFHHCKEDTDSIYKKKPENCLDFEGRPYVYPPPMYTLFAWTKYFPTFESSYIAFTFFYVVSFIGIVLIWADKKILPILYGLGLFITFPNLFLLERGNTDLFITLFWSLAYWFHQKKNYWAAGFFIALPVFTKLYPVFALAVLAGYVLRNFKDEWKLARASFVSAVVLVVMSPALWFEYMVDVLPKWSSQKMPILNLAHSLKSLPGLGSVLFLSAFVFWVMASTKASTRRVSWIWAGGIALSTFNNGVSFDYNLVTIFPLVILGFSELSKKYFSHLLGYSFLVLTAMAFSFRFLFVGIHEFSVIRVVLMIISLIVIPFTLFDLGHEFRKMKFITLKSVKK